MSVETSVTPVGGCKPLLLKRLNEAFVVKSEQLHLHISLLVRSYLASHHANALTRSVRGYQKMWAGGRGGFCSNHHDGAVSQGQSKQVGLIASNDTRLVAGKLEVRGQTESHGLCWCLRLQSFFHSYSLWFLSTVGRQVLPTLSLVCVQLFPAGVVYQPLGSCPYSQPHPPSVMMPMPTGILGTFVKPEETGTKPSVNNVVKSEALGVSPFPENERSGTSLCKKSIEAYASLSFVEAKNDEKRSGAGGVTTNVPALHPPSANNNGSDESMNSSSLNTKDSSADGDKEIASRTNSEQGGEMSSGSWKPKPFRNKQPPWLEKVQVTPELMYKYSITTGDLGDVLQKDMEALKIFGKQSAMVNDQLGMLYNELNVDEAEAIALNLEEGISSNSSGDENAKDMEPRSKTKKPITSRQYRKMVILYEENAPFPPEAEIVLSQSTPAVEV